MKTYKESVYNSVKWSCYWTVMQNYPSYRWHDLVNAYHTVQLWGMCQIILRKNIAYGILSPDQSNLHIRVSLHFPAFSVLKIAIMEPVTLLVQTCT